MDYKKSHTGQVKLVGREWAMLDRGQGGGGGGEGMAAMPVDRTFIQDLFQEMTICIFDKTAHYKF